MQRILSREENPNGLQGRYIVAKADGQPVDPSAHYFVLRLDYGGKDENHIKACRVAILAYAMAIRNHIPGLAQDIEAMYGSESREHSPFSLLDYVREHQSVSKLITQYGSKLKSRPGGHDVADKLDYVLRSFENIATQAIIKARAFVEDVKTQFKATEIITEGLSRQDMNHGQKRVIANHIISTLRRNIDTIDKFDWEYTEYMFDRFNFFRSTTPESNLLDKYRSLKSEAEQTKHQLEAFKKKHPELTDELPF